MTRWATFEPIKAETLKLILDSIDATRPFDSDPIANTAGEIRAMKSVFRRLIEFLEETGVAK